MKKIKSYIAYLLLAGMSASALTGCTDYLDKAPESEISADEAFKNFRNFQGFVEELYFCVPNFTTGYWNNSFNWGEDEIINVGKDYFMGYKVDQGDFWGWQAEHDGWQCGFMDINNFSTDYAPDPAKVGDRPTLWQGAWYGIRKANLGLANLDRLTEATQEQRDIIRGQLLFFRGFFHFQLMQYFGAHSAPSLLPRLCQSRRSRPQRSSLAAPCQLGQHLDRRTHTRQQRAAHQ